MLISHLEALKPFCPACVMGGRGQHTLALDPEHDPQEPELENGDLWCTRPGCGQRYPVIDGIPVIVPDPDTYLKEQLGSIWNRETPDAATRARLAKTLAGTEPDILRQHISTYTHNHFGNADPDEQQPPGVTAVTDIVQACTAACVPPQGPVLDIGCAVGGTTLALSQWSGQPALGVDLNFGMLRAARQNARTGQVTYDRRRLGAVYDERSFPVQGDTGQLTDFWACDALALPFAAGRFAFVNAFNVLDCVQLPADLLAIIVAGLAPDGKALITTPYDWLPSVTPPENWLGGVDNDAGGAAEPITRSVLEDATAAQGLPAVAIEQEWLDIPWQTRLNDRSRVAYSLHAILVARKP